MAVTGRMRPVGAQLRDALVLMVLACCGGCASQPQVKSIDLTEREGIYVLAYVEDESARAHIERQVVDDLTARGMRAYPSVDDFDDIASTTAERVFTAADRRRAVAVLVLDPVNRNNTGSVVGNPRRISPTQPNLQALYDYSRSRMQTYDPTKEAIVEANLFVADGGELFWSGTAWSFAADGSGTALRELSGQITDALADARARLLDSGSGPSEIDAVPRVSSVRKAVRPSR